MIAFGGTIGVGLFLGSATAVQKAGPALVLSCLTGQNIAFGTAVLLLGCAERSSPEAACGASKARGLTANAQTEQP
jgi:L-asparagine transporter-like permease